MHDSLLPGRTVPGLPDVAGRLGSNVPLLHASTSGPARLHHRACESSGRYRSTAIHHAPFADGRGLAAALMRGADGVLVGTRFWASSEALVHANHHKLLVDANSDGTLRTRVADIARQIPWPLGWTARIARNSFTDRWHGSEDALEKNVSSEGPRHRQAFSDGDAQNTGVWFGEAAGLIRKIESVAEIVDRMATDAALLLKAGLAGRRNSCDPCPSGPAATT